MSGACTAVYDFFLYELCDYYLELLKPLMAPVEASGAPSAAAVAAASDAGGNVATAQRLGRATLHVCLERGLQLLHPMMPFVTEELWQRLPGRGLPLRSAAGARADAPSIMVSAYPQPDARFAAPAVEEAFVLFAAVLRGGRSLRADADIPPAKTVVMCVIAGDAPTERVLLAQKQDLATLLRASELTVARDIATVPEGSSAQVISDKASIYLQLKGLVDPAAELAKMEKAATKIRDDAEAIRKRQAAATYKEKVPAEVQEADAAQLAALEKRAVVVAGLMQQYKSWGGGGGGGGGGGNA
jgi:valyl-tRNA synthetase